MQRRPGNRRKSRPRIWDRIMLRLSKGDYVDGLWVGTDDDNPQPVLDRLHEALRLIERYDALRYSRLTRDLERVWALSASLHPTAAFDHRLRACVLHARFVLAEETTLERVASAIIHEATHARLWNCGIGYAEALRPRVEAICVRRELAFAAKLPNGAQAQERAKRTLAVCNGDNLSNEALSRRREVQAEVELRRLGVPDWTIRAILIYRHLIWSMIRFIRRAKRGFRASAAS